MISWISLATAALLFSAREPLPRVALDSLADATAAGIARFADRRVAIAEGYRRVGTDFPSMGEHWLHTGALLTKRLDPSRPTMLAYATINGAPQLIGAGFVALTVGEAASDAPGWPTYWHEHSGALADESGAHVGARDESITATRVWVLHIWTPLSNPLGRYDADNWALPFVRAGVTPPADLNHDIGRAASLTVADGDGYLRRVLSTAGFRTDANREAVDAAIARARTASVAADSDRLRTAWRTLTVELVHLLGPDVAPLLAPPHRHHAEGHGPG